MAEINELILRYESFLSETNAEESDLIERFMDRERSKKYFREANEFGDRVLKLFEEIGRNNRFFCLHI
jgi:hypothetical protein